MEILDQMIHVNWLIIIDEVRIDLNISRGSAFAIIYDSLNFRKVCDRWVPRQLRDIHEENRLTLTCEYLKRR